VENERNPMDGFLESASEYGGDIAKAIAEAYPMADLLFGDDDERTVEAVARLYVERQIAEAVASKLFLWMATALTMLDPDQVRVCLQHGLDTVDQVDGIVKGPHARAVRDFRIGLERMGGGEEDGTQTSDS
jgi:hypothetical protein